MTPVALAALVDAVTAAVDTAAGPHAAVDAVTTVLRELVADPALGLPSDPGPDGSREQVLHVDPDGRFSVVALVWAPGTTTPPHDHVTWGVVGVHRGVEVETRYALSPDRDRLVETGVARSTAGGVDGFVPPGDVHVVRAEGADVVVSLHVYGTDVTRRGSSVKRIYAVPEG